jgi:hypothetical protein
MLKALHERDTTLLIINYNNFLEKIYNLRRIGRSNQNNILKFKSGNLDGIFYIYNNYHDPDEIILDIINYYEIKYSRNIQNIFKIFLDCNIILFIDYESELEDPNFDILLK